MLPAVVFLADLGYEWMFAGSAGCLFQWGQAGLTWQRGYVGFVWLSVLHNQEQNPARK